MAPVIVQADGAAALPFAAGAVVAAIVAPPIPPGHETIEPTLVVPPVPPVPAAAPAAPTVPIVTVCELGLVQ
ncbi:hypothetical protein WT25_10860 [Burkholderia territorii]|nr:hypothetical protein WT25_10860 [Burkholderia territorii]